jgi:hypothetical protein
MSALRVSCARPLARSGERYWETDQSWLSRKRKTRSHTSGVPYVRFEQNAFVLCKSYFSANPKSTNTGTCFSDKRMFAGLIGIPISSSLRPIRGHATYLISLCTTPREWRNWTPERSERNHSLALCSGTSTGTSSGRYSLTYHISTCAYITLGHANSSIYSHRDKCVRRRDDERMKGHDRRVGIILERPDHLHLVPPAWRTISDAQ